MVKHQPNSEMLRTSWTWFFSCSGMPATAQPLSPINANSGFSSPIMSDAEQDASHTTAARLWQDANQATIAWQSEWERRDHKNSTDEECSWNRVAAEQTRKDQREIENLHLQTLLEELRDDLQQEQVKLASLNREIDHLKTTNEHLCDKTKDVQAVHDNYEQEIGQLRERNDFLKEQACKRALEARVTDLELVGRNIVTPLPKEFDDQADSQLNLELAKKEYETKRKYDPSDQPEDSWSHGRTSPTKRAKIMELKKRSPEDDHQGGD